MYGKMWGACVQGIDGKLIEVEIDLSNGLPQTNIVGLPDVAVKESIERVRAAVRNCGFAYPLERITINLAPADLRKEGTAFDLAIAAGLLTTSGQVDAAKTADKLWIGELALDGSLRPVPGVLSMVDAARRRGIRSVVVPQANAAEARLLADMRVLSIRRLDDLLGSGDDWMEAASPDTVSSIDIGGEIEDYADVKGQASAKRALTIAAAGMHNIALIGPPGSGKTMLVRRLPAILPPLSEEEALEVTKIYSAANKLSDNGLLRKRPFRSPHHTISSIGLVGGGSSPRPGEISLAHRGVLFLDELPEFSRGALEAMRQPLEDRQVTISRARFSATFPTVFLLAASMNPCPCGYLGDSSACSCSPQQIERYRSRLSGPMMDRIDLHVQVPRVQVEALGRPPGGRGDARETTAGMRGRVMAAHERQQRRYREAGIVFNAELGGGLLRKACRLDEASARLLAQSFEALGLSARAYDRVLKIARTIADLDDSEAIGTPHLAEALQYRSLDRKLT